MTKDELRQLIAEEVNKQLKSIVQKSVKPLVQEAVAGALANLLAEGIVNGPPAPAQAPRKVQTPNIPQARGNTVPERSRAGSGGIPAGARRALADKMGYGNIPPVGSSQNVSFGHTPVANILEQTAMEMGGGGNAYDNTPSVLDMTDSIDSVTTPDVVDAITRDYSALMNRMKHRGMISG
jgi:hypothetical protein